MADEEYTDEEVAALTSPTFPAPVRTLEVGEDKFGKFRRTLLVDDSVLIERWFGDIAEGISSYVSHIE